jgi:hypothetical protein
LPKHLTPVASPAESRRRLSTLDPAHTALVPAKLAGLSQDSAAQAQIPDYSRDRYRIHYHFGLGAAISLIGVALCGMLLKIRPSVGDKS